MLIPGFTFGLSKKVMFFSSAFVKNYRINTEKGAWQYFNEKDSIVFCHGKLYSTMA